MKTPINWDRVYWTALKSLVLVMTLVLVGITVLA